MNRNELNEKYSQYGDVDKLVDNICKVLTKYHHRNTEIGVCKMIDSSFTHKKALLKQLSKMPGYIGDFRVCDVIEMPREFNRNDIYEFTERFFDAMDTKSLLCSKTDVDGHDLRYWRRQGPKTITLDEYINHPEEFNTAMEKINNFDGDGYYTPSLQKHDNHRNCIERFASIRNSTISAEDADYINDHLPVRAKKTDLSEGLKTGRAFHRVNELFGVNKLDGYNKLEAEFCDLVSGNTRKLPFYLSVNPLDFLQMSFGKSWASCHTINKNNGSSGYHGMYCGGTLSYMNDEHSFITFALNNGDDPDTAGKLYRCVFCWDGNVLIQNRIYPQGNDGATDLYKTFRNFVQGHFSNETWVVGSGRRSISVEKKGHHYDDYHSFDDCNYSYIKGNKPSDDYRFVIGNEGVCPHCGKPIDYDGQLSHDRCEEAKETNAGDSEVA